MDKSHWFDEAMAREGGRDAVERASSRLEGDRRADVCIIGGGFTGLWTALQLKERRPALDVALIEKDLCGSGSSGRNGGFAMSWSSKVTTLLKLSGAQEAVRLFRASEEAVVRIGAFCREHGIDAQFRHDGWLWTASNETQTGAWTPTLEALDRLGEHPFRELSRAEVQARAGSTAHIAGVLDRGVATVQPALLARGLARVAREKGVAIYERTPMTALERARPARVRTPRGAITADTVVFALNAWAIEIPEFRPYVFTLASDIVATEPAPERLREIGWTDGTAISDSRLFVNYYRTTTDGRIAFGKGGGPVAFGGRLGETFDGPSLRPAEVERTLREWYPALKDKRIASHWRGPVTRTKTGLPFFGRMDAHPNIVYGHGYTGNGVGPSYTGGRILASLALGLDDEWTESPLAQGPPGRFPPEPIRYVGAQLVRAAIRRKEAAEDAGQRPRRLDVFLTGLSPAGLVPTKKKGA